MPPHEEQTSALGCRLPLRSAPSESLDVGKIDARPGRLPALVGGHHDLGPARLRPLSTARAFVMPIQMRHLRFLQRGRVPRPEGLSNSAALRS